MVVNVYFKNMRSSDKLRENLEGKLQKYDKFLHPNTKATATFKMIKGGTKLDLVIYYNKNIIKAEETGIDGTNAIDLVIDKIDLQLKKYKSKLNIKGTESIRHEFAATGEDGSISETFDESEEETQNIVKVKRFALKPMSAKEACLQMELIGHQFFVFLDDETEEVHVLYKRKDGDYGLIVPEF